MRLGEPGMAVYRGWMLRAEAHEALWGALAARGVRLPTDPAAYRACHHAPASHARSADLTPQAAWVDAEALNDPGAIEAALGRFGARGVIVKDWVKSQAAGCWSQARHIPDAGELGHARRVIARFRELRGGHLVGGLVLRAHVPLVPAGGPAHEHRAFVVDGRVVGCWPRSPGAAAHGAPPGAMLREVARRMPSPFASAGFGVEEGGRWWLLEIGDGEVSALPCEAAAEPVFGALAEAMA